MKRTLVFFLTMLAMLALLLSSCDGDRGGEETSGEQTEAATVCTHANVREARENGTDATCTSDGGYDRVTYCQNCEEKLSTEHVTVKATGHTAGEEQRENETAATCIADGGYDSVIYCTVCDSEISRTQHTLASSGHCAGEEVRENEISATCTSDGSYTAVIKCTVCESELSRESVTVAASHPMSDGVCTACGRRESTEGLLFTLNTDGKSYTLSNIMDDCTVTDFVVDLYQGLPVTEIASGAFAQHPAFTRRVSPTSVVIGADVRWIGIGAFADCVDLHTVTFKTAHDVELFGDSIESGIFLGCTSLSRVYADDLYAYCRMILGNYHPMRYADELYIGGELAVNLTVPDGVEYIYQYAFSSEALESIALPASVKKIYGGAFSECSALTSVTISEGLEEIGAYAFESCTALTEIEIPDSVKTIQEAIFAGCSAMTRIKMPFICSIEDRYYETNTLKGLFRKEFSSFRNDIPETLTSVTLTKVTVYSAVMFDGAVGLTEVILHDGKTFHPSQKA